MIKEANANHMPLDRTIVIATALELLDEVGLDALTLRRLAEKLKVKAPAIYWHFTNKQDLLDEMATAVLGVESRNLTLRKSMRWDAWARFYGRSLRQALLRYRDGARMVSGTRLTDPSLYSSMETSLKRLTDAGFSSYMATVILSTIYSYVIGFVIEEQAVVLKDGRVADFYLLENRSRRLDPKKTPLALEAGEFLFAEFDRRFNSGLKLIINGVETANAKQ
jgi:TetR/AcrR family transcriptional regulator, tetracycline repressor protein